MPISTRRHRVCQTCQKEYVLGVESSQHKYCSIKCRNVFHADRWTTRKRDKSKTRDYWLKHKYGISEEAYREMLEAQGNSCAICATKEPMGYGWHVDHCHTTNKVRGILCQCCNQAIGLFKENKETIKKAIEYLED